MAKDPSELSKPEPEKPELETRGGININLRGGKRYRLDLATRAYPLKEKPAEVIPISSGNKESPEPGHSKDAHKPQDEPNAE